MTIAAGVNSPARADLCDPFFPDPWGLPCITGAWTWDSTYQAVQVTAATGGWTLGSGNGVRFEFCWPVQTNLQAYANCGCCRLSFDISVHDSSFLVGNWSDGDWYQIHYAANSDGNQGWVEDGGGFVSTDYSTSGPNDHTWHFDLSFAQLGWEPGDTWFQLFFGANTALDDALQFYVANICARCVPGNLAIQPAGESVVLTWTNGPFTLETAPTAAGTYTNLGGVASPYTNSFTGSQQFFRLKY